MINLGRPNSWIVYPHNRKISNMSVLCIEYFLTDTNSFDNPFTDHDETSATIVADTSSGDLTSCQVLEKMAISCAHYCRYMKFKPRYLERGGDLFVLLGVRLCTTSTGLSLGTFIPNNGFHKY